MEELVHKKKDYLLPISILVAAILISVSVVYSVGKRPQGPTAAEGNQNSASPLDALRPLNETDHVRGNVDAALKIYEFSDTECPFCKQFHSTMQQILVAYAGKVAWVYRHYPLDLGPRPLHPKAPKEAEATECANELGGNQKFWEYVDRLYQITPSNNGLDPNELPNVAKYIGLNEVTFLECLGSGKYNNRVRTDQQEALRIGAEGTPFSIIVSPKGKKYVVGGALPYEQVMIMVEEALKN